MINFKHRKDNYYVMRQQDLWLEIREGRKYDKIVENIGTVISSNSSCPSQIFALNYFLVNLA